MSIDIRLEAAEEALKARTGEGVDVSPEARTATLARLLARMETFRAQALEWLETALRLRDPGLESLKIDPFLDPLRKEPRFQAIERELKFPS